MKPVPKRGYEELLELMLASFNQISSPIHATHARELNAAMLNDILDIPGPRRIERAAQTNELIWWDAWSSFLEIHESYEALLDCEVYVRRYPYAHSRISRVRHLLHAIEAYLHESYVLTERLKAFPGLVSKHLTGDLKQRFAEQVAKTISKDVNKSFKRLTSTRGRHTHNERFDSDEFRRLRLLEGLLSAPKQFNWAQDVRLIFESSYRETRNRWSKTISENNGKTREFLDKYCEVLQPFIFRNGKFRLSAEGSTEA